ncbi:MAG: transcription-repair coupling factor, partial [Candidatus Hydrogenedentota bacterium]
AEQFGDRPFFLSWDEVEEHIAGRTQVHVAQMPHASENGVVRVNAPMHAISGWQGDAEGFWKQLEQWDQRSYSVVLFCNNSGERRRLFELLQERGYRPGQDNFDLRVEVGQLQAGFVSQQDNLAILSERELFGRHYVRRKRRRFEAGSALTAFGDLKIGDYIVHEEHGIGRYLGLRRFEGKAGDFLTLKYAGGDTVYVPATHIDSIQKYTGGDGAAPKIDRLGGATWAKTKAKVKKSVQDMTDELLKLYARRESQEGTAFSQDTHWQVEFEDSFPYDETPDQARAITEVKADMEQPQPMDRLVCGDVGYGKTEVALRAAFKAVMEGKQVCILVPTTVLAEQHYLNFRERLADYPTTVEMMSRFRSSAELKRVTERLKSGEVEIVVGTHRLLSKDIQFKNLGLLIIDEEQRFGVKQKEKLKELRTQVDVITLSATPIPRTLNMSLMGVRDMSVINTAPNDRLPIHTCIEAFDEQLIEEAIRRELAREGQVFFVHNRVQTIQPYVDLVRKLVPEARVGLGHGQMAEKELEAVMTSFVRHELDVLVCTTIIGSGLDIPNANTIIINNADHFGLSELYQLRGRVGRYKHRAFAYLLIPGDRALSEDAQKRLKALEEFSSLGSGLRIAMRDMEIRGCGNLLGAEQHGNIAAVGYDTYTQLVQEAVAEIKGEPIRRATLPPFDFPVDAHIPPGYVPDEGQKITLYKRISSVHTTEDVDEMRDELADRFGAPPAPVKRLLDVMRLRTLAAELGAKRIVGGKQTVVIELDSGRFHEGRAKGELEQRYGRRITFSWKQDPAIELTASGADPETVLNETRDLLNTLLEM